MDKYRLSEQSQRVRVAVNGEERWVDLRQVIALRDIADVPAGTPGGWVEDESCLSQHGQCWLYAENSVVLRGARVEGDARVFGDSQLSDGAWLGERATLDHARLSHGARVGGSARVQHSTVCGNCLIDGAAQVLNNSEIDAARGMTANSEQIMRISDAATIKHSRVVHQAQIYDSATLEYAFVEHRAAVYGSATLQGNEEVPVWVCDCAQVYGHARVVAGRADDQCPTLRYSSRVYGNAVIEGDCVLKHHVQVCEDAVLCGGPLVLDNHVLISGSAQLRGAMTVADNVSIGDAVQLAGSADEPLLLCGPKTLGGTQRIARTPYFGVF